VLEHCLRLVVRDRFDKAELLVGSTSGISVWSVSTSMPLSPQLSWTQLQGVSGANVF